MKTSFSFFLVAGLLAVSPVACSDDASSEQAPGSGVPASAAGAAGAAGKGSGGAAGGVSAGGAGQAGSGGQGPFGGSSTQGGNGGEIFGGGGSAQAGSGQAGSGAAGSGQAGSGTAGSGQAGSGQAGSAGVGGAPKPACEGMVCGMDQGVMCGECPGGKGCEAGACVDCADGDKDGVCDGQDACPGRDDAVCGPLPRQGKPPLVAPKVFFCPEGHVGVGVKLQRGDYLDSTWLICRPLSGETLGEGDVLVGGQGNPQGGSPVEFRCDKEASDGVMVGQQAWVDVVFGTQQSLRSVGAICQSLAQMKTEGGKHATTWAVGDGGNHTLFADTCPDARLVVGYNAGETALQGVGFLTWSVQHYCAEP